MSYNCVQPFDGELVDEGERAGSSSMTKRYWRPSALAAVVGAIALALAACGGTGSSAPSVANVSTTSSADHDASTARTAAKTNASPSTRSSSNPASSHSSGGAHDALGFAECIRSHGVPNFPDPGADGSFPGDQALGNLGIDPNSPTYTAAEKTCQPLLPAGSLPSSHQIQQAEQAVLTFARCVRSHGVPNFPDPKFNTSRGAFVITISGPGSGIDLSSPF